MRRYRAGQITVWSVLVLTWLGAAGCNRAEVDRGVRQLERSGKQVGENVRHAAETAKGGAARAKQKLPQATERVREELVELGHEARVRWDAARDKWRRRHPDSVQPHR